jgi:hypothetical protein
VDPDLCYRLLPPSCLFVEWPCNLFVCLMCSYVKITFLASIMVGFLCVVFSNAVILMDSLLFSDSKFLAKAHLVGAVKTFHNMLQTYYNHNKLLYPALLVIKCLARSCKYKCTNVNVIEFRLIIHSGVSVLLYILKGVMMEHYLTAALHNFHCLLSEVCLVYTMGSVMAEVVMLLIADFWICFWLKLALMKLCAPELFVQLFLSHRNLENMKNC